MIFNDDKKMGAAGCLGIPVASHASGFTKHDVTATPCVHVFGNVANGIHGAAGATGVHGRAGRLILLRRIAQHGAQRGIERRRVIDPAARTLDASRRQSYGRGVASVGWSIRLSAASMPSAAAIRCAMSYFVIGSSPDQ